MEVPQILIQGPLLFFIYTNDLAEDVQLSLKFFAGDTSLFTITNNHNATVK